MFTIHIQIGNQSTGVNILPNHTARQILDYLQQNHLIPQFQANFHLRFNGSNLPLHEPLAQFGVGPNSTLEVVSQSRPGFGGSGRDTLLSSLLKAFTNLK